MKNSKEIFSLEEKLIEYRGEDRMISSHEIYDEMKKTPDAVFKITTGFPYLDRTLEETEAGEMIVVTGPTDGGKTTLLMSITKNLANRGVNSAWFTLEVTPRQFIKKIISGISDPNKFPLFYMPAKNADKTIAWIEERIVEAKVKYNVRAIFIDHIHQIFSLAQVRGNVSLELGDMVAKIKDIAVQHNLVVYLIAHTKDDPTRPGAEPVTESIRDSGLISRLADTILAVWRIKNCTSVEAALASNTRLRPGEGDTWAKIRILKNRRNGQYGTCVVAHQNHELIELARSGVAVPATDLDKEFQNL